MRLVLRRIATIGLLSFAISACSTTTGTINTPVGKIQIGMYMEDVEDILGQGTILGSEQVTGENDTQLIQYPTTDGRRYVVYYVNEVVRRWELKDSTTGVSQAQ